MEANDDRIDSDRPEPAEPAADDQLTVDDGAGPVDLAMVGAMLGTMAGPVDIVMAGGELSVNMPGGRQLTLRVDHDGIARGTVLAEDSVRDVVCSTTREAVVLAAYLLADFDADPRQIAVAKMASRLRQRWTE